MGDPTQLPGVASHLKAEWTIAQLDQQAQTKSDTQAAADMQEAKRKLFESIQGSGISQAAMRLPLVGQGEAARSDGQNPKRTLKENQCSRRAETAPVGRPRAQ